MTTPDFLHRVYYGNSLQQWLVAAAIAASIFLVLVVARRVFCSRLGAIASRTTNLYDDLVVDLAARTRGFVLLFVSIQLGARSLNLSARVDSVLVTTSKLLVLLQIALWGAAAVNFWMKHYLDRRTTSGERTSVAMIRALNVAVKFFIWVVIVFAAMDTFGVRVTALITGLGVGGIAIALAVQNVLGDVLAALAIVFDKPFDIGDTIGVDQITGTVEHIGLKTTHIRSINGEQIIIGNSDLLKSKLRNFRRMQQRRVVFQLDLTFDTSPDILQRIPAILQEIVTRQKPVRFERSHVASFGESSIRVETVYFVLDPDYIKYMDIQQAINIDVLRRFAAEKVRFALPSRTVYHEGPMAKGLAVGEGV